MLLNRQTEGETVRLTLDLAENICALSLSLSRNAHEGVDSLRMQGRFALSPLPAKKLNQPLLKIAE